MLQQLVATGTVLVIRTVLNIIEETVTNIRVTNNIGLQLKIVTTLFLLIYSLPALDESQS